VSTTLVNGGPLWGAGEAARGNVSAAPGFAVGELAGFPKEASSRAQTSVLDAITTTVSIQKKSRPVGRHA
jgi:hypothetical protein